MENFGVPPDVVVDNTPADHAKGRDAQIEKAVAKGRAGGESGQVDHGRNSEEVKSEGLVSSAKPKKSFTALLT
jgi:hypothetical protein